MVNAKLHVICGNCGCSDQFIYFARKDNPVMDEPCLKCENCCTVHEIRDNVKRKDDER